MDCPGAGDRLRRRADRLARLPLPTHPDMVGARCRRRPRRGRPPHRRGPRGRRRPQGRRRRDGPPAARPARLRRQRGQEPVGPRGGAGARSRTTAGTRWTAPARPSASGRPTTSTGRSRRRPGSPAPDDVDARARRSSRPQRTRTQRPRPAPCAPSGTRATPPRRPTWWRWRSRPTSPPSPPRSRPSRCGCSTRGPGPAAALAGPSTGWAGTGSSSCGASRRHPTTPRRSSAPTPTCARPSQVGGCQPTTSWRRRSISGPAKRPATRMPRSRRATAAADVHAVGAPTWADILAIRVVRGRRAAEYAASPVPTGTPSTGRSQDHRVLERLAAALAEVGRHRVGGVAEEGDAADVEPGQGCREPPQVVVQHRGRVQVGEQVGDRGVPAAEAATELVGLVVEPDALGAARPSGSSRPGRRRAASARRSTRDPTSRPARHRPAVRPRRTSRPSRPCTSARGGRGTGPGGSASRCRRRRRRGRRAGRQRARPPRPPRSRHPVRPVRRT